MHRSVETMLAKMRAHADRAERCRRPDVFIWLRYQDTFGFKLRLR